MNFETGRKIESLSVIYFKDMNDTTMEKLGEDLSDILVLMIQFLKENN